MWQDLIRFKIPWDLPVVGHEIVIHGFGVMLVIGFLCAMWLAKKLAIRCRLDPEVFANAALLGLFAGVLGARLSHIIENIGQYTRSDRSAWDNLRDAMSIASGGLTYYGGFLLAFPTLVIYGWIKKVPIRLGMDIIAPCLMIGLAFGRVGCFLNGCCYGAECDQPFAVVFPKGSYAFVDQWARAEDANDAASLVELKQSGHSRPVHAAQLYSAFTAFLLAGFLVAYFTVPHPPGRVFAVMMILEGAARYVLEMLRVEPSVTRLFGQPMTLSMVLGIIMAGTGVALWIAFVKPSDHRQWIAPSAAATS